jgi:hypothetical protein
MPAYQQRNQVLRDLEKEYSEFLREELRVLEFGYSNMVQPKGKDAKDKIYQGKLLNRLLLMWIKLKQLETEKDVFQHAQDTCVYIYLPKEKKKYEKRWAKAHTKQLDLADDYMFLKNEYKKLYS